MDINKYSRGKIYTIRCHTDATLVYVGSTIEKRLSARFAGHKRNKKVSLYKYVNDADHKTHWDDWYIELHELYPCTCIMELCKREGEVIREIATINKRGLATDETNKQKAKQYREANKEKMKEYNKSYAESKKEELQEYRKVWYKENIEVIKEKKKKNREENKEFIKEKAKKYREENREHLNLQQQIKRLNKNKN